MGSAQTATVHKHAPLGDRGLVRPTHKDATTKSGILIPDTAQASPQEGEVIAVGPGRGRDDGTRRRGEIDVGETVLYSKYAGGGCKVGGEDHLIAREPDVVAVVAGYAVQDRPAGIG